MPAGSDDIILHAAPWWNTSLEHPSAFSVNPDGRGSRQIDSIPIAAETNASSRNCFKVEIK
jgi:hypothetical protein